MIVPGPPSPKPSRSHCRRVPTQYLQRASVASNTGHLIGGANPHQRTVRELPPAGEAAAGTDHMLAA
jgi:hypothetical protein